jgi:hypothetical protein
VVVVAVRVVLDVRTQVEHRAGHARENSTWRQRSLELRSQKPGSASPLQPPTVLVVPVVAEVRVTEVGVVLVAVLVVDSLVVVAVELLTVVVVVELAVVELVTVLVVPVDVVSVTRVVEDERRGVDAVVAVIDVPVVVVTVPVDELSVLVVVDV